MDPMTAKRCRTEFFIPDLTTRTTYEKWTADGRRDLMASAAEQVETRLAAYVKPDIDPAIENDLETYIRKGAHAA